MKLTADFVQVVMKHYQGLQIFNNKTFFTRKKTLTQLLTHPLCLLYTKKSRSVWQNAFLFKALNSLSARSVFVSLMSGCEFGH